MNDAQNLIRDIEKDLTIIKVKLADLNGEIDNLKSKAHDLEKTIDMITANKVDMKEFSPVQRVVYGIVSLIVTAVILGMLGLVLAK